MLSLSPTNHFATRLSPCSELSGNNTADDLVRTASPLHAELWCPADRLIGALFGPSPRAMVQGTRVQTMVSGDCCRTLTHSCCVCVFRTTAPRTATQLVERRDALCMCVCKATRIDSVAHYAAVGTMLPPRCVSAKGLSLSLPPSLPVTLREILPTPFPCSYVTTPHQHAIAGRSRLWAAAAVGATGVGSRFTCTVYRCRCSRCV